MNAAASSGRVMTVQVEGGGGGWQGWIRKVLGGPSESRANAKGFERARTIAEMLQQMIRNRLYSKQLNANLVMLTVTSRGSDRTSGVWQDRVDGETGRRKVLAWFDPPPADKENRDTGKGVHRALLDDGVDDEELMEAATRLVRRVVFGLKEHQELADFYEVTSTDAEAINTFLPGRLPAVAHALQMSHDEAMEVARSLGDGFLVPDGEGAQSTDPIPYGLTDKQRATLATIGREARWIPPDGDSWFESLILAAQKIPNPPSAVEEISKTTADLLRLRLRKLLTNHAENLTVLMVYAGETNRDLFRKELESFLENELSRPGRSRHRLFDALFRVAPGLLGVPVAFITVNGTVEVRGPKRSPGIEPLYLVQTGVHPTGHYMPALLLGSRVTVDGTLLAWAPEGPPPVPPTLHQSEARMPSRGWLSDERLAEYEALYHRVHLAGQRAEVTVQERRKAAIADYRLRRDGLGRRMDVGAGGDCFFWVLIATFQNELRSHPGLYKNLDVRSVRKYLAKQVRVEYERQFRDFLADSNPNPNAYPIAVMISSSGLDIDAIVATIETMGRWNNNSGDLMVGLAMHVFRLSATVLGPVIPEHAGAPDRAPTAYLWYTGGHYQVVITGPGQEILRADQLHPQWERVSVDPDLQARVATFVEDRNRLVDRALRAGQAAMNAGDARMANELLRRLNALWEAEESFAREQTPYWLRRILETYRDLAEMVTSPAPMSADGKQQTGLPSNGGSGSGDEGSHSPNISTPSAVEVMVEALRDRMRSDSTVDFMASDAEALGRLIVDPFGVLEPSTATPLGRFDQSKIEPAGVASFLAAMSMIRATATSHCDAPELDELEELTSARAGQILVASKPTDQSKRWNLIPEEHASYGGEPPPVPPLPDELVMPLVLHYIWLGSPLVEDRGAKSDFRKNVSNTVAMYGSKVTVVVWTDVSRQQFNQARQPAPTDGQDPAAGIREMLEWATAHAIHIVNIDEVFHAGAPMALQPMFGLEMAKQIGEGYAAASDIARVEILHRFGGIYSDGDNVIGKGLMEELERVLSSQAGFAFGGAPGGYGNQAIIAPAGHPALALYRDCIERRTSKPSRSCTVTNPWLTTRSPSCDGRVAEAG